MTQRNQILAHLKAGRPITPLEALREYGTMRLGARIFELKQGGHNINKRMVEVETRDGMARVAEYRMA